MPLDPALSWFLTDDERDNPQTRIDERHPGHDAWSTGNRVRPLIHGATYFTELYDRIEATSAGDLVYFTDWQGNSDEQLTGKPGSEVSEVLGRAGERGVDVRGLVWRSHTKAAGFASGSNRHLGKKLQSRGAEALLDMRVRLGGSHHQKMVVIRHRDDSSRDIAYVGGIDLCHSRRDDADHAGDPQAFPMAEEYGPTPPWHDIQAAISGPAVHDVETVFRERWEDPTPLSRNPFYVIIDRLHGLDRSPDPLPEQQAPPAEVDGGTHAVQLLRTYPDLRFKLDYEFAHGGERSVARGYRKAIKRARHLVYIEDQYMWGTRIGDVFTQALHDNPDLHVIAVVPIHPDKEGSARTAQLLGRRRAMQAMLAAAPDRVAVFGIENHAGTPVYVHAKACIIDDTWATVGSDNFNRRSWTHDSELTAAVVDLGEDGTYARDMRLTLAGEHLDRTDDLDDCVDPRGMYDAFVETAAALDRWHAGGQVGDRPPGRLRRLDPPAIGRVRRALAAVPYSLVHDPDGRPRSIRGTDRF